VRATLTIPQRNRESLRSGASITHLSHSVVEAPIRRLQNYP
jgi:hypothetical protein